MTGLNSLAVVSLADVGKIMLGPATTAMNYSSESNLALQVSSGFLCVQSDKPAVSIKARDLSLSAADESTNFDLIQNATDTKIAVYRGEVNASFAGKDEGSLKAGSAAISMHGGDLQRVPIASVSQDFTALHCPDSYAASNVVAGIYSGV